MEDYSTRKYPSKVSYGMFFFVFFIFFGPIIYEYINGELTNEMLPSLVVLVLVFGIVALLFFNTYYLIDKDTLKIHCGFFNFKPIDISKVEKITKTNSILSSPAPSFDRIEVYYGDNSIIISPKDKIKFVKDLKIINPNIQSDIA